MDSVPIAGWCRRGYNVMPPPTPSCTPRSAVLRVAGLPAAVLRREAAFVEV